MTKYKLMISDFYNMVISNFEKVVPNFFDKDLYVLHYENLTRIKNLKKLHRVLGFNQSQW